MNNSIAIVDALIEACPIHKGVGFKNVLLEYLNQVIARSRTSLHIIRTGFAPYSHTLNTVCTFQL